MPRAISTALWTLLVGLVLAVGLLYLGALFAPARAHPPHDWINDPAYKSEAGSHCCGQSDCMLLSERDVRSVIGGFSTPSGFVPNGGVYQSRDGKVWLCMFKAEPKYRCLFLPGAG